MNRASAAAHVLREVVLHPQAHALARAPACATPQPDGAAPREAEVVRAPQPALSALVERPDAPPPVAPDQARREGYAAGLEAGRQGAHEAGRQQGMQEGEQAGRAAALAEYRSRIERLDRLLAQLQAGVPARLDALEDDMVALVFDSVCRICGDTALAPDGARAMLLQAVAQLRARPLLAVRMHPQDLLALQDDGELKDLLARLGPPAGVQWLADEQVGLGGCRLDSGEGSLDARLETQLQRLGETLLQVRQGRRAQAGPVAAAPGATP